MPSTNLVTARYDLQVGKLLLPYLTNTLPTKFESEQVSAIISRCFESGPALSSGSEFRNRGERACPDVTIEFQDRGMKKLAELTHSKTAVPESNMVDTVRSHARGGRFECNETVR